MEMGLCFCYILQQICTHITYMYSQTCFSDHISTKTTSFVSLGNGFSLKHVHVIVLKEPVYKDHLFCFPWAVTKDRFERGLTVYVNFESIKEEMKRRRKQKNHHLT